MSRSRFLSKEEISKKEPVFLISSEIAFDFGKGHSSTGKGLTASRPGPEAFGQAVAKGIHVDLSRGEEDSPPSFKVFEAAVAYFKRNGFSVSDSLSEAVKQYPGLHEEYLWRVNHRGPCWLKQALAGKDIPK